MADAAQPPADPTSATPSLAEWAAGLTPGPAAGQDGAVRLYRSYRDTWQRLAALTGPGAPLGAHRIGESALGQPLWSLSVEPDSSPVRTTLVVAGLHAMEHVGVATAVALLERAAAGSAPWRTQRHRLVVVPMANPDGFRAACASVAAGSRRFVRTNARGVDLNRNFAIGWDRRYYLHRLLGPVFAAGAGPLSEPETQALDRLAAAARPTYAVSLHAFGRWIYLPYAGSREAPPDQGRLLALGRAMAAAPALRRPYRVRQLGRRSRLFQARGAEIDHFYRRHGALSFLIEIGAGPRLAAPDTWTHPYAWFTPPAPLLERDVAEVLPAVEYLASA